MLASVEQMAGGAPADARENAGPFATAGSNVAKIIGVPPRAIVKIKVGRKLVFCQPLAHLFEEERDAGCGTLVA